MKPAHAIAEIDDDGADPEIRRFRFVCRCGHPGQWQKTERQATFSFELHRLAMGERSPGPLLGAPPVYPRRMPRPKKPRIGRPPRAGKTADRRLEIRLTADEERAWTDAAGETPVSTWVRDLANRAAKRS